VAGGNHPQSRSFDWVVHKQPQDGQEDAPNRPVPNWSSERGCHARDQCDEDEAGNQHHHSSSHAASRAGAFAAGAQSRARGMHHGPFGLNGLDFPGPALRALAEARREFGQDYKEGAAVWYAVVAGADRAATGSGTARASSSACFALTSGRAGLRRAGLRCAARACLHGPVGRGRLACRGAGWLVGSRPRGGVQPGRQAAGQRRRLRRASRLRSAIS
jgi:hypothetical protein